VLDRDDDGGEVCGEVTVDPVGLHRRTHESAAVDVNHQRQGTLARRAIHAHREFTVRQRHLLPADLRAAVREPGDQSRQTGGELAVLRVPEGDQLLDRQRRIVRFLAYDVQQPDAQRRLLHSGGDAHLCSSMVSLP
jgi:hypothetical protein